MTYVALVNQHLKTVMARQERLVAFGQNISTGSCLSGLCRGIDKLPGCTVLNTTNAENTLVGMGFGLMLKGVSSIFFMKQQDFLLLGLDQLTNTWNALRNRALTASFTIVAIVVDSGFEGPQSCLNNLPDFSSFSRIPGYTVGTRAEVEGILDRHLVAPGVRILGVSQRLFRQPPPEYGTPEPLGDDGGVIAYARGEAATVVSFNLAFPEAMTVHRDLAAAGRSASLYSVAATLPQSQDLETILDDVARTGRLVVVDDTKSIHTPAQKFLAAARARVPSVRVAEVTRSWSWQAATPNADQLMVDSPRVLAELGLSG
ncbi:MAG: hypothetical protein ABT940_06240 [Alphaproteobacteria bacterium]